MSWIDRAGGLRAEVEQIVKSNPGISTRGIYNLSQHPASYRSIKRAVEGLREQNLIRRVKGGWEKS